MLETINMVQVCCPVGVSEEIMAVFLKKSLNLTPKMTNVPKFSVFQSFDAFFVKFWRLRGLECFKGSTRKTLVVQ